MAKNSSAIPAPENLKLNNNVPQLFFDKQARENRRISMKEFAKESGVAISVVQQYMAGNIQRYDSKTVVKLMNYLNVDSFDKFFIKASAEGGK